MPTMTEMQEMVEDKVVDMMILFEDKIKDVGVTTKYDVKLPEEIRFDQKGTVAGISCFNYHQENGYLNFNPVLMAENWDEFFNRTVIHEVAHYCVSLYTGFITTRGRRSIHGRSWKAMMQFLGAEDISRCHNYDTSNVARRKRVKRFEYECACGFPHPISTRLHNMIERGQTTRICSKCRGTIRYNGTMRMIGGK